MQEADYIIEVTNISKSFDGKVALDRRHKKKKSYS